MMTVTTIRATVRRLHANERRFTSKGACTTRVTARDGGGTRLLEDVVSEIADEVSFGVVWVFGGPGGGKSTALSHLAAVFAEDARFVLIDEPSNAEVDNCVDLSLVVATTASSVPRGGVVLRLTIWNGDDLAEFLLTTHPEQCGSVFKRLGHAPRTNKSFSATSFSISRIWQRILA